MITCNTHIERYLDKSGKYIAFDTLPANIDDYTYCLISIKVEGNYSYVPARINCRIDDSYPAESESEIISAVDENGKDWVNELTNDEVEDIIQLLIDNDEPDVEYDCD